MKSIKVVAEIGNCHLGSLDRAKELAHLAFLCGADYLKTQKRNPEESVPEHIKHKPHPAPYFAYGDTYLEHRCNLELSQNQHSELKLYCHEIGIKYGGSAWDITSARELSEICVDYIKIPSSCNSHYPLMRYVFEEYPGTVHISTGMTQKDELLVLRDFLKTQTKERIVLYHCTSEYPCPFGHLYLREIETLHDLFAGIVEDIGFSNHGYGIAADIVACMLGATWVERHFIDDRTIRHTDAPASLEPDGLRRLARDLKMIPKVLQYKEGMTEEEVRQRDKLKQVIL